MKLNFTIEYGTAWGESIHVVLTSCLRDGREKRQNLTMTTADGRHWAASLQPLLRRDNPIVAITYYYQLENAAGECLRKEWTGVARTFACDDAHSYEFNDCWKDLPLQYAFYTSAYQTINGISKETDSWGHKARLAVFDRTVVLRVSAPQLRDGEELAVSGSDAALGGWSPTRFLRMTYIGNYEWMLSLNVGNMTFPLEYKYVVIDKKTGGLKQWEDGQNRTTGNRRLESGDVIVVGDQPLRVKERQWKAAGVVVPLFSLRSSSSCGVGDFGDLHKFIDWAASVGMSIIQLLPINDTTRTHSWTDSNPYNIVSSFAIHPHYLDIEQLPPLKSVNAMTAYHRQQRELNDLDYSDYEAVDRVKLDFIAKHFAEHGNDVLLSDNFNRFFSENSYWLKPYAAFMLLSQHFGTSCMAEWKQYAIYDEHRVDDLLSPDSPLYEKARLIYYTQYLLYSQMHAVASYARRKHVALMGDMPVGVGRYSVATWMHPECFNLDMNLGTPPADGDPAGQNWGFPAQRWQYKPVERKALSATTLRHAVARQMSQMFDAVRLDHVSAYFRQWEIPSTALSPLLGHFSPSLPLSEADISAYGITFRRELFTEPFINDDIINRTFGIHAAYVRQHYLDAKAYGMYQLKADYSTQVKVQKAFAGRNDENSLWIRDGLYRLLTNVLFIEDDKQKNHYHPRWDVINASVYDVLSEEEKAAFVRLYRDYFHQRQSQFWHDNARRVLQAIIGDTRMLVSAENLGLMSDGTDDLLDELRILTTEIQTMPKTADAEFRHLNAYPYRSIATTGTHDMPTLRQWWEENPWRTQRYYQQMLQKEGRAPRQLSAVIAEEIVSRHLYCPSMICMLSIQDWLSIDSNLRARDVYSERINAPFDSYNKWKYRINVNIETLSASSQYNEKLRMMIQRSKRG